MPQTRAATPVAAPAHGLTKASTPLGPLQLNNFGTVPVSGDKDRDEAVRQINDTLHVSGWFTGFAEDSSAVTADHQRAGDWLAKVVQARLAAVPGLRLLITGTGGPLAAQRAEAIRALLVRSGVSADMLRTSADSGAGGGAVQVSIDRVSLVQPLTPWKPLPSKPQLSPASPAATQRQPSRGPVAAEGECEISDSYGTAAKTAVKAALRLPDLQGPISRAKGFADRVRKDFLDGLRPIEWVPVIGTGVIFGGITVYGLTQSPDMRELAKNLLGLTVSLPSSLLPNGVAIEAGPRRFDFTLDLGAASKVAGQRLGPFRLKLNGLAESTEEIPFQVKGMFVLEYSAEADSTTGAPR
ncbi:hypothetical protein [Crossiella sp. NPDC003009]